jgi:hypothetical protein
MKIPGWIKGLLLIFQLIGGSYLFFAGSLTKVNGEWEFNIFQLDVWDVWLIITGVILLFTRFG